MLLAHDMVTINDRSKCEAKIFQRKYGLLSFLKKKKEIWSASLSKEEAQMSSGEIWIPGYKKEQAFPISNSLNPFCKS